MENEVRRAIDVSQWELSRDRSQISEKIQYKIQYYKDANKSNDKFCNISNIYISLCGIKG